MHRPLTQLSTAALQTAQPARARENARRAPPGPPQELSGLHLAASEGRLQDVRDMLAANSDPNSKGPVRARAGPRASVQASKRAHTGARAQTRARPYSCARAPSLMRAPIQTLACLLGRAHARKRTRSYAIAPAFAR